MNQWNDNSSLPWESADAQTTRGQTSMPSSSNVKAERAVWFQQGASAESASRSSGCFDLDAVLKLPLPAHCEWQQVGEPDERVLKIVHHHLKKTCLLINLIFFPLLVLLIAGMIATGASILVLALLFTIIWYVVMAILLFPKLKPTWIVFKKGFIEIGHDKIFPLIRTQISAQNATLDSISDSSSETGVRSDDSFVRRHYRKVTRYYKVIIEDQQVGLKENIAHQLPVQERDAFMYFMHELIKLVKS